MSDYGIRLKKLNVWDSGIDSPSADLYKFSPDDLRVMLTESNLEKFEKYIHLIEEGIFEGPFTAQKIEENLRLILIAKEVDTIQGTYVEIIRNNPYRETIIGVFKNLGMTNLVNQIETGQQPTCPDTMSLSEKKNYYLEVFEGMTKTLTAIKNCLQTIQRKTSHDNRIVALIERYKKCDQEIDRICGIVRRF